MGLSRSGWADDVVLLLYAMPIIVPSIYALTLWPLEGLGPSIPKETFLIVTKEPLIFLAGVISVCGAIVLEARLAPIQEKQKRLAQASRRVRDLAIITLVLGVVSAWSATGYSRNMSALVANLLNAKFPVVFPTLLLVMGLLLTETHGVVRIDRAAFMEGGSVALLIAAPLAFLMLTRIGFPFSLAISVGLALMVLGILLYAWRTKIRG